jgi:serine/threonine-protein kinase
VTELSADLVAAIELLEGELPTLSQSKEDAAALGSVLDEPGGELLFSWCSASLWRRDVRLAPLLAAALARPAFRDRALSVARERVVQGPMLDALACAPLLGDGVQLAMPVNAEARSRLEILIWEAGASAVESPDLGKWLWGAPETFEVMIRGPARGALRGRVLAARCLEVSVRGMPQTTDPELVGRTLQTLQPLLLHPEPLVWVHAARALGRLTGPLEQMEGTILDWVLGESPLLRQRAMTAFASLPAARYRLLANQLLSIIDAPDEDAWVLAAIAAATPYLFFERRDIWDRLAARILQGDGGAIAARALARGLATLWRRGTHKEDVEGPIRVLREMARAARPDTLDDSRRWIEVIAMTDVVDGAERDPLDLELGLENLVRLAAQYDDEEADARAARFAVSLATTFAEARRIALGTGRLRQRAAAINAVEGLARAFALRLWGPLLATRPAGQPIEAPDLEETWKTIARAPAEILDLVKERRQASGGDDLEADSPLEVLAIRLGGYALDACGEDAELGPGRGPTVYETCLWLRKLEGLANGTRELPVPLKGALSTLFWRVVDAARGTALGEVDDVLWLGPFAAWWALVIDRPAMLLQLATALPMMDKGALERCCEQAQALRTAVSSGEADGQWGQKAAPALDALNAVDTELTHALAGLSRALSTFSAASGAKPNIEAMCLELVLAGDRLQFALADPVKALHPPNEQSMQDSLARSATENAPRVAALVARAVRSRDLSMLDVWLASLGPVASALLEQAVRSAIARTPPPPPAPKNEETKLVEGYELVKSLGEGGIGTVWLVRKPGADRYFVLKIPKADTLQNATDTERAGILASFVEEAKALAGLYHPNVANIIDRGVSNSVPFLVLEYLIGADLKQYSAARLMTLFELRQVVLESCAGLAALHSAGLVHRDIKPANLWLRLPLKGGEKFDPDKHREPAHATPLSTVVIDFGMVRAIRVPPEVGGKFVAGTAGYIAPEQVLDPVELDPRSDVYALAGTIYNVTTGRAFFDDIENARDRIIAHMKRDPLEDAERLRAYPAAIAKLLRAATARDPADRPSPIEFGREFVSAI